MTNKELVETFYEAFKNKDYKSMNSCYSADILFSDPVFGLLEGRQVRGMWAMLLSNARDFTLNYGEIADVDEAYITCNWVADYSFSGTGNHVTNRAKAFMKIADGLIIEHSDGFRLSTWLGQAFGWKGKLLGWTGWMKKKVHKQALRNLEAFLLAHPEIQ
ncbi:nuclear transport factor 2 family protein [Niabella terrae]